MNESQLTKQENQELNFLKTTFENPTFESLTMLDNQVLNQFLIKKNLWQKSFRFLSKEKKTIIFCNPRSKKAKGIITQANIDVKIHNQNMSIQLRERAEQRKKKLERQKKLMSNF